MELVVTRRTFTHLLEMLSPKTEAPGNYRGSLFRYCNVGSGGWIRTNDLRVMSPTSCHCSTPRRDSGAGLAVGLREAPQDMKRRGHQNRKSELPWIREPEGLATKVFAVELVVTRRTFTHLLEMLSPKTEAPGNYRGSLFRYCNVGSGGWIRTNDLRVMSPTSCHCSTPRRDSGAGLAVGLREAPQDMKRRGHQSRKSELPWIDENKFEVFSVGQTARLVSTGMLKRLLSLHTRPIKQIVSLQSYSRHYSGREALSWGMLRA